MIGTRLRRLAGRVVKLLGRSRSESPLEAWDRRAREFGARAVFNLAHGDDQLGQVTELQRRTIYPHLREALRGNERLALDFGCGPGRFTADLAKMIGGRAIGVDTTRAFIEMAPRSPSVEYQVMTAGRIPAADGEVDLLWICLVMGGIVDNLLLQQSIRELDRVLRPDGLLVVVENTSERDDAPHWKFRSVAEYQRLFDFARLEHKADYEDVSERISVLIGRKNAASGGNASPGSVEAGS